MIRVTCAIIRNDENEVLVVQRGEKTDHPFKWEFPGGKLKEGETEEDCIIREIREELSMDIVICRRIREVEYDYGIKQIVLVPFICDTLEEIPFLNEHTSFKWLAAGELMNVDFCEADILVAGNYLIETGVAEKTEEIHTESGGMVNDEDIIAMINCTMGTTEVEWLATSAGENPEFFEKLLGYSFSDDKKLAFHASWALTKVCDKHPEVIYNYLPMIIKRLDSISNDSARRSFLRSLSLCDPGRISSNLHGILADHCFNSLKSGFSSISIKAYSMDILYKLAIIYPELTNELAATIHMLQGEGSAGIIARGRIILKKLANSSIAPGSGKK